jgi:hypothetical protein
VRDSHPDLGGDHVRRSRVRLFARRIGRNESFSHAGNASAAALAGGLAYFFGPLVVFRLLAGVAAISIIATLRIPADAIDHTAARGLRSTACEQHHQPSRLAALLHNRKLATFAVAVVLFHFANAAMLPLVGQQLALNNTDVGTTLMAACIVAAQAVMVPVAFITGARADRWGRKPIFLVAFAVLTMRGFLFPLSDDSHWLVGVQLLDGIGAGIFGALFPLVVSDVTQGTGRYNVSLGAIVTAWGLGASLSNVVAGWIVVVFGYHAAFISLGVIAAVGFALYLLAVPETRPAAEPLGGGVSAARDGQRPADRPLRGLQASIKSPTAHAVSAGASRHRRG